MVSGGGGKKIPRQALRLTGDFQFLELIIF